MNTALLVICLSLALQLLSAFVAFRLIITSEKRIAGALMLVATVLMAFRRIISLYRLVDGGEIKTDLFAETVGCTISLLVLIGFVYVNNLLKSLRVLGGLLPICASCKKIKDDQGNWQQMEMFIRDRSDAEFTHGLCPQCADSALREVEKLKTDVPNR